MATKAQTQPASSNWLDTLKRWQVYEQLAAINYGSTEPKENEQ